MIRRSLSLWSFGGTLHDARFRSATVGRGPADPEREALKAPSPKVDEAVGARWREAARVYKATIAPPNSFIVIMDPQARNAPETTGNRGIVGTEECIAVACRSAPGAATELVFGWDREVGLSKLPVFEGWLRVPSRRVTLKTVLGEELASLEVAKRRVIVRIWADHPREPDHVVIGIT